MLPYNTAGQLGLFHVADLGTLAAKFPYAWGAPGVRGSQKPY